MYIPFFCDTIFYFPPHPIRLPKILGKFLGRKIKDKQACLYDSVGVLFCCVSFLPVNKYSNVHFIV